MERKQGYGWRFLPVAKTPEALTQIYRFRSIIEPAAFMEDTFQLDRHTLKELKGIQRSLLRSEIVNLPADRLATINSQFHEELIRMSGNLFMHQALVRLNRTRRLLEYRSMIDRSRIYKQCEEHLAIIELLARGANLEAELLHADAPYRSAGGQAREFGHCCWTIRPTAPARFQIDHPPRLRGHCSPWDRPMLGPASRRAPTCTPAEMRF